MDVVYNQDRGEHLKAMTRLIKIFNQDGDKDKETLYKRKPGVRSTVVFP